MSVGIFHPSSAELERYADTGPQRATSARLREHLAECKECRGHVAFLRSLPDRVATLEGPQAHDALFARIEARLASQDVVILPTEAASGSPRRAPWLAAAAVLLIAVATWLAWPASDLTARATTGDLRFSPDRIVSGPIEVRYHDAGLFAGAPRLTLRARYRTVNGDAYNFSTTQQSVATLMREKEGEYRATLRVPDSVVYASFAVESPDGSRVDHNGRKLWRLLRYRDGHPAFEALWQYSNDLMGENMELAMRVLQEQARIHGDVPGAWAPLVPIERFMLGRAHADSTVGEHCARLQRFDAELRARAKPSPAEVSSVRSYAVQLDYDACPAAQRIARVWRDWLVRDTSSAPEVLVWRYQSQLDFNQPARALALAEKFWPAPTELAFLLYNNGLNAAIAVKDSAAILRWADRNAAHTPANAAGIYTMVLMRAPMVHNAALDRLRGVLRRLRTPQDSLRPLERTTAEQARTDSASVREIMATIGDALVSQGKVREGLDSLERATTAGWDPALFRRVARTALKIGKTEIALPLLARVAVDPSTSRREADSLATVGERFVSRAAWAGAVRDASEAMRTAVMADATIITLDGSLRLQTTDATTQRLSAVLAGRVGVVTFWSRFCAPSLQDVALLPTFANRLDSAGVALIAITEETPSPAVRAFVASRKLDVPTYHDTWGEASRAFQAFGTPQYFVVDDRGRIRFRYTTLAKALTQAVVLTTAWRAGS